MAAFVQARDEDVPASLRTAWENVEAAWDKPAAHEAVLELTVHHAAFAWTAARYRDAKATFGASAEQHLARIRKSAEATLLASATAARDNQPKPYKSTLWVLGLAVLLILLGLMYAVYVRAKNESAARPVSPPSQVR